MSPSTPTRIGAAALAALAALLGLALLGCSDTTESTAESSTAPPPPVVVESSTSAPSGVASSTDPTMPPPPPSTPVAPEQATPPAIEPGAPEYVDTGMPFAGPDSGDVTTSITAPLADGVYFAESARLVGGGTGIEFQLRQRFSGDACAERFGTAPASCPGGVDFGSEIAPATMVIGDGTATVIGLNATGNPIAFEVSHAELARLVGGEAPAADAPAGFAFVPYPFIVTVSGGEVVTADQQFQS